MVDFGAGKKVSQPAGTEGGGEGEAAPATGLAFDEVVGQDELKTALLAVAANDDLDGLLIAGEKGTAKSTLVRGLADLLPDQPAVADCPYGCHPTDSMLQCSDCRTRDDSPVEHRSVPLVTLPLGATRDRVVGTVSVSDALDGEPTFDPGLLARAHRGILYVDEVNLLDDHLVDVLLDAAASGVNRVERDGVSARHPADLTLVGTMNPEEGDLRPQLRDRFALQATATGCDDVEDRVAIVRSALGDDSSSDDEPKNSQATIPAERLRIARRTLDDVDLPEEFLERIATLALDAGLDGHRGDLAMARTARTLAALDGRTCVIESDVRRAAAFALPHRLQSRPFDDAPSASDLLEDHFEDDEDAAGSDGDGGDHDASDDDRTSDAESGDEADAEQDGTTGQGDDQSGSAGDGQTTDCDGASRANDRRQDDADDGGRPDDGNDRDAADADTPTGADADENSTGPSEPTDADASGIGSGGEWADSAGDGADNDDVHPSDPNEPDEPATPLVPGQQRATPGDGPQVDADVELSVDDPSDAGAHDADASAAAVDGPRIRTRPPDPTDRVDPAATVRAAAARGADDVTSRDLRATVRRSDGSALVVFAVDASASMRPAMRRAKGTVLELLRDAYQQREEVAFVAFGGDDADVLLPPTDSVQRAARHLKALPTADQTPLPAGIRTAADVIDRADPDASVVVLVTDGRANRAEGSPVAATRDALARLDAVASHVLLVDVPAEGRGSLSDLIVERTGGSRIDLESFSAGRVDAAVERVSERD